MKLVYVEWLDAVGSAGGWEVEASLKGVDGKIKSIGWVIDENEEFVLVAGHVTKGQTQGAVAIPHKMITSLEEIVWRE